MLLFTSSMPESATNKQMIMLQPTVIHDVSFLKNVVYTWKANMCSKAIVTILVLYSVSVNLHSVYKRNLISLLLAQKVPFLQTLLCL